MVKPGTYWNDTHTPLPPPLPRILVVGIMYLYFPIDRYQKQIRHPNPQIHNKSITGKFSLLGGIWLGDLPAPTDLDTHLSTLRTRTHIRWR